MIELPTPNSVLTSTLLWLGVPFLLLLPINFVFWLGDWFRALQTARNALVLAHQSGKTVRDSVSNQILVKWAIYLIMQAALAAIVYSSFRLAGAMMVRDSMGRNIADGKSFTWSELWFNFTRYDGIDPLAVQAFWFTIGWLIAVNFAHLVKSKLLIQITRWPSTLIAALCGLGAVAIGAVGLMVLSLATWMNSPEYNIGMVSLYAFWVLLLGGGGGLLASIPGRAERLFRS